ncbi:MAG: disulfide bond formation protein B [Acidimicrobiia bacterium]|nr:disulfide bond formation protein B [Acidimicrobiia bacterium]
MAASTINAITLFFSLLAIVAGAITVAIALSAASGDRLGVIAVLRPVALELAAAVATTAMVGSLVLSEVIGFEPCLNCWIQRGFMYPAAFLLIGSLTLKRPILAKVAGWLAIPGLAVSIFHRYEQAVGTEIGGLCAASAPCSTKFVEHFGFMTIPTMAGCGFAAIIALVAISAWRRARPADPSSIAARLRSGESSLAQP